MSLRPWISDIGVTSYTPGVPAAIAHVPDAAVRLAVRTFPEGGSDVLAIGPRTRASYHADKTLPLCLDLRIRPGAARPLLGTSARELVGRVVPLAELPGPEAARLARRLGEIGGDLSEEEAIAAVTELLPPVLVPHDPAEVSRETLVRTAVAALSTRPGRPLPASVATVARELAVSERQLRKLFTDDVGVSPKHFARIDRARQVLAGAARGAGDAPVPWAGLAQATGYYDQSHMAAEFRSLFGVAPTAFVSGRLPAATPCLGRRAAG
ncbi:helix-turn-helix domain-containing protein [Streptomyces sp. VRA16 Mangrove soil]|nr:helix-turn-helix domain-containing protein [Streptomyces sp. VRA16 Mangrove soil]